MSIFRKNQKSGPYRSRKSSLQVEAMEPRLMFTLPAITAQAAIVTTGDGEVLGELNAHDQRHMASTTKIMTALVAIEESAPGNGHGLSLQDTVDVGYYPANLNILGEGSGDGFDFGDQATLEDMLFATMLQSDNEAAQGVAEHIAIHQPNPSLDEVSQNVPAGWTLMADFAELMNDKAKELGMDNSSFRTPDGAQYVAEGLPGHGGHYSTAYDMALLARSAMANERFYDLVGTTSRTILVNGEGRNISNGNRLVRGGQHAYPGAEGVKTGYTPVAGRCLVSQATLLGHTINAVVLGSTSVDTRYEDTHALLNYGFQEAHGFTVDVDAWQVHTQTATYDVSDKLLTIEGTAGADVVSLDFESGKLRVEVNGVSEEFPFADLDRVEVKLGGGNDEITVVGDIVPFEVDIDGGHGSDTLHAEHPLMLGAITDDLAGELIEWYNGTSVATFSNMETVLPDDYADSVNAAAKMDLMRGCPCNVDINLHGFMGSVDDEDWVRFDSGSGSVTMDLSSLGPVDSHASLQLWNISSSSPVLVDAVAADAPAKTIEVTHGSYAFKVDSGGQLSEYQLSASVPSSSLTSRDLIGIPEYPGDFWRYDPELNLGGRGPDPSPIVDPIPVRDVIQKPMGKTVAQPLPSTKLSIVENSRLGSQLTKEKTLVEKTDVVALLPLLVDAAINEQIVVDSLVNRRR